MKFSVCSEETNNKMVLLERSIWTGKSNLYIDNVKLKNVKRNKFVYRDSGNNQIEVTLKGNEITGFEFTMNNKTIALLRKLNVFEMFLTFIPIALVVVGGAIGGLCAALGMIIIAINCRNFKNNILKLVFAIGIYGAITAVWIVLHDIFLSLL